MESGQTITTSWRRAEGLKKGESKRGTCSTLVSFTGKTAARDSGSYEDLWMSGTGFATFFSTCVGIAVGGWTGPVTEAIRALLAT
jgi:hypothetical protein